MQEVLDDVAVIEKLDNSKYTYKSTELIESSYELSVTEQRLISMGCKLLQPLYIEKKIKPSELTSALAAITFSQLEFTAAEYRKEFNIKANNIYGIIEEAANNLFERKISYFDENGDLTDKRWVSTCKYDSKNNRVYMTFNIDMIQDLLVFKGKYVALFFDMTQNVKSKYAYRLYEILKMGAVDGVYIVTPDKLRFMLALGDMYSNYGEFNRTIIKPNIAAINKFSDISVTYTPIKSGRTVQELKFTVDVREDRVFSTDTDFIKKIPNAYEEISKPLREKGLELSNVEVEELYNRAIEVTNTRKIDMDATSYIMDKIEQMYLYAVNVKTVGSVMSFLIWAIENNYKYERQSFEKPKNNFNNFKSRDYNFAELEPMLLGEKEYDAKKILNNKY